MADVTKLFRLVKSHREFYKIIQKEFIKQYDQEIGQQLCFNEDKWLT